MMSSSVWLSGSSSSSWRPAAMPGLAVDLHRQRRGAAASQCLADQPEPLGEAGTDDDAVGRELIGFSAGGTTSRRDFGVTFGLAADGTKLVVADQVDIVLDVQAFLAA